MMRKRMKQTCVVVLLAAALFMSVQAQNNTSSVSDLQNAANWASALDEYQQFLAMLVQLREPLAQAALAAYEAVQAYAPEDQIRNAQLIVNILEGAQSPLYNPAIQPGDSPLVGVRTIYDAYLTAASERHGDSDGADFAEGSNSIMPEALQYLRDWIRLASAAAATAAETATDELGRRDALLTAQAFIFALIEYERALTQPLRVTVKPGESIQSAIDHAWPGATVSVEPGIYRETLDIRSSVTVIGLGFDVILEPVNNQDGIIVTAEDGITVELRGIAIRHASTALSIEGAAIIQLDSIQIEACETGLRISDDAALTGEQISLNQCGIAILVTGQTSLELADSWINDSTNALAAVIARGASQVTLTTVRLNRNLAGAILLEDAATLRMDDCGIYYSQGDGVMLTGSSTMEISNCDINLNDGFGIRALTAECGINAMGSFKPFVGTITGAGNLILSEGKYAGNRLGSVCPESLMFLTEPNP
ncbi:right-handed parallel beta-helix repeat-containing protein [Candidatus Bipolaricaulota bacterium]|nr:right-handed parallel beta-helix repeat-containing protein [Candidatus Bipolaricaulota bacterium]